MKTGRHLKIKSYGEKVLGVELEGNPKKPEPVYFRVYLPNADIDIVRCDNGEYWVHINITKNESGEVTGRIVDARLDISDKPTHETQVGDFNNPNLMHLAVRIGKK